jgi:BASS family bile acid:Na+ symporter
MYSFVGYIAMSRLSKNREDKISSIISMAYINNVLVAVFAAQFFGSQVAALAAVYNIPYYMGIAFLKKF